MDILSPDAAAFAFQFGSAAAFLVLSAAGLAIIFGMMGVVNLAHGELIMIGAYGTSIVARLGWPLPLAMLCGIAASTLVGFVLERAIIHRLYQRPSDSLVVTWAMGLVISQGMLILLGPSIPGIPTPLGNVAAGDYTFSVYRVVLIAAGICVPVLTVLVMTYTTFGIQARATMQNPEIARAIGINSRAIYSITFAIGSALAGLAGALYAPTMSIVPTMGGGFIVQSFVTVVIGGGNLAFGTLPAAFGLGIVQTTLTAMFGNLVGVLGLLAAVILSARFFPRGLAYYVSRRRVS